MSLEKKILIVFVLLLELTGSVRANICNTNIADMVSVCQQSKDTCEKDSMLIFLNRFCSDSVFQCNRIKFPIMHVVAMDAYGENNIMSSIIQEKWEYFNFLDLPRNYIIKVNEINDESFKLNIQIVDTGVCVNYLFELIDCIWFLTKIIDESI